MSGEWISMLENQEVQDFDIWSPNFVGPLIFLEE